MRKNRLFYIMVTSFSLFSFSLAVGSICPSSVTCTLSQTDQQISDCNAYWANTAKLGGPVPQECLPRCISSDGKYQVSDTRSVSMNEAQTQTIPFVGASWYQGVVKCSYGDSGPANYSKALITIPTPNQPSWGASNCNIYNPNSQSYDCEYLCYPSEGSC